MEDMIADISQQGIKIALMLASPMLLGALLSVFWCHFSSSYAN